jgi:8-oxo-dGTP pyrophosphatase MutT (NUDIX family)
MMSRTGGTAAQRQAARVILLDSASNTLLLHYVDDETIAVDPNEPDLIDYWVTPGGGVEAGESLLAAAHRELKEETGFAMRNLNGPVIRRSYPLIIRGVFTHCVEHLFIARLETLRPEPDVSGQNADELGPLRGLAWWSPDELRATGERIFPDGLHRIVTGWLAGTLGPLPLEQP